LPRTFYLSVDTLDGEDLFEIAEELGERYRVKCLLLDEVHFQPGYDRCLKKIFDFLKMRVIFTSSVSLSLFDSTVDLSRRATLEYLYPFTYREYLFFRKDLSLPKLTLEDIIRKRWTDGHIRTEYLFDPYLQGGLMPFSLEEPEPLPILKNILEKIIHKDIPSVARLRVDELPGLKKMVQFVGRSPGEGINFSSLSRNIGITKYKAEQYVNLLAKTFVLNPVYPTGTNVLREPKVLMYLPFRLLYREYDKAIGYLREDFFAEMMRMKGLEFDYLKSKRGRKTPDFLVRSQDGDIVVEVGGRGKGREQFKGIKVEKQLILSHPTQIEGIKRPLFLLGFI
jgi:predicted AAA+ superfamily ATPase